MARLYGDGITDFVCQRSLGAGGESGNNKVAGPLSDGVGGAPVAVDDDEPKADE